MNTLQDIIARLLDLQQLRGPDCPVIVKIGNSELQIDGIRNLNQDGRTVVIINVIG